MQERAASGVEMSEEEAVAELRQGLRDSNTALETCQDQLRLREEEVQDLSHHLQAAQADISSLQVLLPDIAFHRSSFYHVARQCQADR